MPEDRPYERRYQKSRMIDQALKFYKDDYNTVLQAGGHYGVWPNRLKEYFYNVYTFEAHPENYKHLLQNKSSEDIHAFNYALGNQKGTVKFKTTEESTGMHHISDEGELEVPITTIDDFCQQHNLYPSAFFLDIEGFEIPALEGAKKTIVGNKPLIVCEENHCLHRYGYDFGDIGKLLKPYRYRVVRRFKSDVVYAPCN